MVSCNDRKTCHRNRTQSEIEDQCCAECQLCPYCSFTAATLILLGWVFKFQCMLYEKHEHYVNRKRQNYDIHRILCKLKQIIQLVFKIQ